MPCQRCGLGLPCSGRFRGPSGRAPFSDEGGFTFSEAPFEGTLHEGLKGASPSEGFKGASPSEGGPWRRLEGGFKPPWSPSSPLHLRRLQAPSSPLEAPWSPLEATSSPLKPSEGEAPFDLQTFVPPPPRPQTLQAPWRGLLKGVPRNQPLHVGRWLLAQSCWLWLSSPEEEVWCPEHVGATLTHNGDYWRASLRRKGLAGIHLLSVKSGCLQTSRIGQGMTWKKHCVLMETVRCGRLRLLLRTSFGSYANLAWAHTCSALAASEEGGSFCSESLTLSLPSESLVPPSDSALKAGGSTSWAASWITSAETFVRSAARASWLARCSMGAKPDAEYPFSGNVQVR